MVKSMTGFGKAQVVTNDKQVTIEVKSLNSKQQDVSVRMPGVYKSKEIELRNTIIEKLQRGKIEFNIYVEITGEKSNYKINKNLIKAYRNQISDFIEGEKISPELLGVILKMPDVMNSDKEEVDENEWSLIMSGVKEALDQLNGFREEEGNSLAEDLLGRLKSIEAGLQKVIELDVIRMANVKERLSKAIQEIQQDLVDKNRFEQEVIYYLEKLDINEEKVRLKSHCDYFLQTMNKGDGVGKKLGFIAQEMGREINTIGSKANDSEIQKTVVMMKDDLEKIKEQVLNVL